MLRLRSSFAAPVAVLLLLGGPARAALTRPVAGKNTHSQARRQPAARPTSKASGRAAALALATPSEAARPRLVCLAGVVRGADGRPGPGACVFPTPNPRQLAVTNAEGAF